MSTVELPSMPHLSDATVGPAEGSPVARYALFAAGVCALLAIPALWVDLPLANWCLDKSLPGDIRKLVSLSEVFSHGLGVGMILLTIFVLDPTTRVVLPRIVAASWGAGIASNGAKLVLERTRPHSLADGFEFSGISTTTFGDFLNFTAGSAGQSFPSSHTATGLGLAVVLAWRYPRGRVLFPVLGALAAWQRLDAGAHYLSDVLAGAAIGCLIGGLCVAQCWPGSYFSRLEAKLREASRQAA